MLFFVAIAAISSATAVAKNYDLACCSVGSAVVAAAPPNVIASDVCYTIKIHLLFSQFDRSGVASGLPEPEPDYSGLGDEVNSRQNGRNRNRQGINSYCYHYFLNILTKKTGTSPAAPRPLATQPRSWRSSPSSRRAASSTNSEFQKKKK